MDELAQAGLGPRPFARWSDTDVVPSSRNLAWLAERLGELTPAPAVPVSDISVPDSALTEQDVRALRRIVGDQAVHVDTETRLAHAGGQSYTDLIRRRSGHLVAVPDGVVRPSSHDEVADLLAEAGGLDIAIVPYGGGTSVVGGVEPFRGSHHAVVTVDLSLMNRLLEVDDLSQTARFEPGLTGPQAEVLLGKHGLTLGHVPQSFPRGTIGGFVATRSAGQASTGYGRMDELVVALRAATPVGTLSLGTGTPNAAGPDLRALFIGSEGTLGVLTELTLRVRPAPAERRYEMWTFPSFERGLEAVRELVQADIAPDVVRLSDEEETATVLASQGTAGRLAGLVSRLRGVREPAFCVVGWEGDSDAVQRRRRAALTMLRGADASSLGTRAGDAWRQHRFDGPKVRDALLDVGVLVETLETATSWSRLPKLYTAVAEALRESLAKQGTPPVVMTHVSHVYPTGASLYFTVLARKLPEPDAALEQWNRAKEAANSAIVAEAATITHHHAVGRVHAPFLSAEVGDVGMSVLRSVKTALDPDGILNPGVLIETA
ncbi:MAG TPA: FAD-binding oxidoreductase [Actinopolymorphaceae bacterium]|jgi:alkyldihydroxyacetonephosphate synthase